MLRFQTDFEVFNESDLSLALQRISELLDEGYTGSHNPYFEITGQEEEEHCLNCGEAYECECDYPEF
jgi:hypothetical protein